MMHDKSYLVRLNLMESIFIVCRMQIVDIMMLGGSVGLARQYHSFLRRTDNMF